MLQLENEQQRIAQSILEFRAAEQRRQVTEASAEAQRQQEAQASAEQAGELHRQIAETSERAGLVLEIERGLHKDAIDETRQLVEAALAQLARLEGEARQTLENLILGGRVKLLPVVPWNVAKIAQPLSAMQVSLEQAQAAGEQIQGGLRSLRDWQSRRKLRRVRIVAALVVVVFAICLVSVWVGYQYYQAQVEQARQAAIFARILELNAKMAAIPAGEFQMGSENGAFDEQPVHIVYLDGYFIDAYEVTNALYAECVASGDCAEPGCGDFADAVYANHPVTCVSWDQAQAYCRWRGGQLPTEAQWEKAARGGLEGRLYPWGDEEPTCVPGARNGAQYVDCGGSTVPVGSFAPNGYGLYDMAGNVREWVQDWYSSSFYGSSPRDNPISFGPGSSRVLRSGGDWDGNLSPLRVADRLYNDPGYRYGLFGFRCLLAPGK
ncbi:MAG: SUMF1/EgtB/PvdO family nonheme iron enzyme [Chloroflexota bacterium]